MPDLRPQPSINDLRARAHQQIGDRLAAIDLTPLLVYRLDSVPAAALPFLGWQFDLVSPLWQLLAPTSPILDIQAEANAQRRSLIKLAVPLHRQKGTPGAIKASLAALGFTTVTILEGQNAWGGNAWPANQGWAVCRIMITIPTIDPDTFGAWDPTLTYPAGSGVTYNGLNFWAYDIAGPGTVPQFASVDAVTNWDNLSDTDNLVQAPWFLLPSQSPLYRPIIPGDEEIAAAIFDFFKPARCWLDSIWFVLAPLLDSAPVPRDRLSMGGVGEYQSDLAPAPAEGTFSLAIALPALADTYGPIAPLYNAHYRHSGITYGANEPTVADSALILNGVATLEGG